MQVRRFRALVGAAAVVTVGLGALVGCGEDEPAEPQPLSQQEGGGKTDDQSDEGEPSEDASPSATPSKSSEDPTESPSQDDTEGDGSGKQVTRNDRPTGPKVDKGKKIVRDYYIELDKAFGNGDVAKISELAASSCEICESTKENILEGYSNGGKIKGGKAPDPDINASGSDEGGPSTVTISVTAQITAEKVLDAKGNEVKSHPPEEAVFTYEVDPSAGKIVKGRVQ